MDQPFGCGTGIVRPGRDDRLFEAATAKSIQRIAYSSEFVHQGT
jgi:hypothetical protein